MGERCRIFLLKMVVQDYIDSTYLEYYYDKEDCYDVAEPEESLPEEYVLLLAILFVIFALSERPVQEAGTYG